MRPENLRQRVRSSALMIGGLLALALLCSCISSFPDPGRHGTGCGFQNASGQNPKALGALDFNAGYMGFVTPVKPGERLVIRAQFPHARYISFNIYDQDFMLADSLSDAEIEPSAGVNPFRPGMDRSGEWLGEYEIQVLMEKKPEGKRPPNTLYAGETFDNKKNRTMMLAYRMYLADQGYGYRDNNPLAVFGGVEPGFVQLYDKNGKPYCPSKLTYKLSMTRVMGSILRANTDKLKNPKAFSGHAKSPPIWSNNASRETQKANTYVPNDETSYIFTSFSAEFGELLVLRWKAPQTPEQTYTGAPFPKDYDMRYWSLSFEKVDPAERLVVLSVKTLADVDVPHLPDGTRQVVIGLAGVPRPESVPENMWVGLDLSEGLIIERNIQIDPDWPGNFGKIDPGPIPPEHDKYTPGGVYCSIEEFKNNPDIGLKRAELISKQGM